MNVRIAVAATATAVALLSCGTRTGEPQRAPSPLSAARKLEVKLNGYVLDLRGAAPAVPPELDAPENVKKKVEVLDLSSGDDGHAKKGKRPRPSGLPLPKPADGGKQKKWIVQFAGPVGTRERRQLEDLGGRIGDYLPDFAFVVTLDDKARHAVEQLPGFYGITRYKPAYKIQRRLKDETGAVRVEDDVPARLHLRVDIASSLGSVLSEVHRRKGKLLDVGKDVARVEIRRTEIARLAQLEEVIWIEEAAPVQLLNDTSRWVIQTYVPDQTRIWDMGLHGEGQIVGVGDTGLDYDMCFFRDPTDAPIGPTHRKVVGYASLADDYDGNMGHGTHVSGTVAGDQRPITGQSTANGMAPLARLFMTDITPGEQGYVYPPADLGDLFITPYQAGARFHTNSWGAAVNEYDTMAFTADRFLWEHKDLLVLFANGNSGPGEGSVGTPANAKDVVSVGATENGASAETVAWFSSNGPTWDGRIKPTVTAPGVGIVSADSDGVKNSYNCGTIAYSGTSMATPTTAGAAALVRQYYNEGYWPSGTATPADGFAPSAALVKATLVSSAQNATGDYTDAPIPSTGQGWGRINLSNTLRFAGDTRFLEVVDFSSGLDTAASWTRNYFSLGGQPLKVTLVWTDYPGSTAAAKTLVNDLDLQVTAPDGTVYLGNVFQNGASVAGGSADRLNVEEQVLVPAAPRGSYTVTVTGYNVPFGPQPFALVVTGAGGITSAGFVGLDRKRYNGASMIEVKVGDSDLNRDPVVAEQVTVSIRSTSEPGAEPVVLRESGTDSGVFIGTIRTGLGGVVAGDGVLQVADGDTITAIYEDANDGSGAPATVTASAVADLAPPAISAVTAGAIGQGSATISWTTSEPSSGTVEYGETPALGGSMSETWLTTGHALLVGGLKEATRYFFAVRAVDEAGNAARDDNGGTLYSFTTVSLPPDLTVYSSNSTDTYRPDTLIFGTAVDPSGVASVTVNGTSVDVRTSDGYYEMKVPLSSGENVFTVVATDTLGNARTASINVFRHDPPDLVLQTLSGPAQGGMAESIHVEQTLCNIGAGTSPGSGWIAYYLSVDPVIDPASDLDFLSYVGYFDYIAPGECIPIPVDIRVPGWTYLIGNTYWFGAYVDVGDDIWESDETNNAKTGNQIQIAGPDFVVTSASGPSSVGTAASFAVTSTVQNVGMGASYGAGVGIYLSTDPVITASDKLIGYRSTGFMYAGTTSTATTTVTIPSTVAAGQYYLGVIVDPQNFERESNEENNVFFIGPITVAGPDLVMTAVQGPTTARTGDPVVIHNTVAAQPTGGGAGGFMVTLYLSSDPVITKSDVQLAYRSVDALASGASSTADTSVTIPANLPGGTYYIGAIADTWGSDPWGNVLETDETNNALAGNAITIAGPDIVVTSATGPASGVTGGTITVPNTVVASATGGSTPGFYVGVFLSTDPVITASDTLLGYRYVPPMAPGAESTEATVVALPTNLVSGTYYLGVIADDFPVTICDWEYEICNSYGDEAKESDETNNVFFVGPIAVTGPDLTVDAVSGPAAALTGKTIVVRDTVRASGGGAGWFGVSYYLSRDATITKSDVYLGRRTLNGLATGQTSTADTALTVPLGLAPGPYTIGAIVDADGMVTETDETNNALAGNAVTVVGPDLVETAVSAPPSAFSGTPVTVSDTVAASGSGGDAGGFWVGIYLSRDAIITTADTQIASRWVPSLSAGASSTGTTSVTIPGGIAPGTWFIGAIADYASRCAETDETNNAVAGNAVVIAGPDLVPESLSGPATALTGGTITISSTVTARPTGATASGFAIAYYLSTDPVITTADVYLGQRYVPSLASGASSSGSTTVTIPAGLAGGTYYLGAIVDPWNSQPEADETNNALVGNTITVVASDLVAASVTGPATAVAGSTVQVQDTVIASPAGGAAPEFLVGIFLSSDPTITANDLLLGYRYVSGLPPGGESSASTAVVIPVGLAPGTYYLGIIADDFSVYIGDDLDGYWFGYNAPESDETNNALAGNAVVVSL